MLYKERTLEAKIKAARAIARREYIKVHGDIPTWLEIHHKDFCPLNNSPDNLQAIDRWSHIDLHSDYADNVRSNKALDSYLSNELDRELKELNLLCNIHNSEYGKYESVIIEK